jgi:hypothetical protein
MPAHTYRLKINQQGLEFDAEGDKTFVIEMLKRFLPQSTTEHPRLPSDSKGKDKSKRDTKGTFETRDGKSLSIREFVQGFSYKKHTDIVLAFGYYLEKFMGISEFTPADINNCYYEAKMDSSNTSQMIIRNIKRGYIMPSKKKSEKGKRQFYTLTSSGEEFIKSKLPANA